MSYRQSGIVTWSLICLLVGGELAACNREEPRVLATIDGVPVYLSEVEEDVGEELVRLDYRFQRQRHQLIESALERLVRERLLEEEAAMRGMSTGELIAATTSEALQISEQEVADWYERNRAALGGRSLEELYPLIEEFLQDQ
ncbi:MAG: hypothetical protein JSV41_11725, partial [Gemmatimonadota bacterium]